MASNAEKAAQHGNAGDLRNCDLAAINSEFNPTPLELQARRLRQLHALSYEAAATLAPFVFAVVPR